VCARQLGGAILAELGCGLLLPAWDGVSVDRHRGPHVGVAEDGLCVLRCDAGRGEVGRAAVASLVRGERLENVPAPVELGGWI
jgi:hypothetical protein